MLKIDKAALTKLIEEKKPKRVMISCPSGIIAKSVDLVSLLALKYKFEAIFSGEPCYGICDLNENDVASLGVDLLIQIGHTSSANKIGRFTYLIEAHDDVDVVPVIKKAVALGLLNYKKLGLCTIGPHLSKLNDAKLYLEIMNFEVFVGEESPPLKSGQIYGCNFSTCSKIFTKVDAFVFVGSSRFHAIGLYNCFEKPVIMLDPYMMEVVPIEKEALAVRKRLIFNFYKAVEAKNIGIIVGLKEGQMKEKEAFYLQRELSKVGKKVFMITMREISDDKLIEFKDVDAFIETACPRIGDDPFSKPMISLDYGYKLLEYFRKSSKT
jgi:2-(3-amino-3-carboxypropyl)histidine synthase